MLMNGKPCSLMARTTADPELLTCSEAAALLNVSVFTMRRWAEDDKVPYIRLPGGNGDRRFPREALLASLGGNYDIAGELAKREAAGTNVAEGSPGVAASIGSDPQASKSQSNRSPSS